MAFSLRLSCVDCRRRPRRTLAGRLPLRLYLLVVLCFPWAAGCGGSDFHIVPVSGAVTLDGKPVADILVTFQPKGGTAEGSTPGPGSFGITDESGRFELDMAEGSGAVPGEHTVTLIYKDPNVGPTKRDLGIPEPQQELKLPSEARDGSLTFVVPTEGTDKADFALESTREPPKPRRRSRSYSRF